MAVKANRRRLEMKTTLDCPCGERIKGKDEDDLVEKAKQHLKDKHPHLADTYEREHILFMAH
jgi:predicted small metal-binding protein